MNTGGIRFFFGNQTIKCNGSAPTRVRFPLADEITEKKLQKIPLKNLYFVNGNDCRAFLKVIRGLTVAPRFGDKAINISNISNEFNSF